MNYMNAVKTPIRPTQSNVINLFGICSYFEYSIALSDCPCYSQNLETSLNLARSNSGCPPKKYHLLHIPIKSAAKLCERCNLQAMLNDI